MTGDVLNIKVSYPVKLQNYLTGKYHAPITTHAIYCYVHLGKNPLINLRTNYEMSYENC